MHTKSEKYLLGEITFSLILSCGDDVLIKMSKKKINLEAVMKLLSPSLHHINLMMSLREFMKTQF